LYVYTSEDGKWSEIDRVKGKATGDWKAPTIFKMENKVPVRKERAKGPLVYVVGQSQSEPVFVAIEFQTNKATGSDKSTDLSSKLDLFFKEARLEKINDKPCVRFFPNDDSGFVSLEKFKTTLSGERFIFEYGRGPVVYNEDKPLEVVLASSGEIELGKEVAEQEALAKAADKPAGASSTEATNQDYFTRAKESFLAPLAERAGRTNANDMNSMAQQLYPALNKIMPPAVADIKANSDVSKKSLAEVNHIIVETLVSLTKDPTAYGLIDLTPDRKSEKSQKEKSGSDGFDPSLQDPVQLSVESLKDKTIQAIVDRAKSWIDGREDDVKGNAFKEEDKKRAELLKPVLDDLRKGLNKIKELGPQRAAAAPPDSGTAGRERKAAEAKLAFLEKLQAGGPFDNEQGRLLFRVPASANANEEYVLEPNLLLKPASK
jgi:hypothetical protein